MRARQTIHAVQLGARRASTGGAAVLDWRSIPSPELEYHFVPRLAIPDASQTFERFAKLSAAALSSLPGPFDVAYGRDSYEVLDVHAAPPSAADPPLVVFVHGGYWRALDKRDHHFVVAGLRSSGFSVVNVNYPLAPGVSVTRICASVAAAVRFVAARREAWGLGTGALALFGILAGAVLLIAVGGLVAATNEAASAVRALFLRAKPQDFGLIGGRELWLEYLDSNPIAYTVHGLVMNGALFNSLAYALVSCLVMVVLAIQKDTSVAGDDDGD